VFEAINLFLAGFVAERRGTRNGGDLGEPGGSLRARFVIGLDPVVVAGHLDRVYADLYEPHAALEADDPSPGWGFLRKLVHLPILVPQVSDEDMFRFVDRVTNADAGGPVVPSAGTASASLDPSDPDAGAPPQPPPGRAPGRSWLAVQDPRVRQLIRDRLAEQPDRSIREATRQLNLWQFYDRVLATAEPLDDGDAEAHRTRHLVILAEIVSRWPSLQRHLHRRAGGHTCLQQLAMAVDDERRWQEIIARTPGDLAVQTHALKGLRDLLRRYDGAAVADLAARLF
jgi:hypothetical protein